MDQPLAFDHVPGDGIALKTPSETSGELENQRRDRRREKPLLSCTFCRRRKVRCNRQIPCNTCISKGIALSCSYSAGPQRKGTASVREHIQQLESLVRSLAQQQTAQASAVPSDSSLVDPTVTSLGHTPREPPTNVPAVDDAVISCNNDTWQTPTSLTTHVNNDGLPSPAVSEHGSMRMHSRGGNYVNNVHWAAVLDSISELKDHYEQEEDARMRDTNNYQPQYSPSPRLFYEPVQATKADILAAIPVRPVVDRMVSRYFNTQGVAPAVIHSGQFLQEYETFWREPSATSFAWIALLFSILGLSTQFQYLSENSTDPDTLAQIHLFRERTVNCLVLAQYTRAGPHILETMLIYYANETLLSKDSDLGLWLLIGMLVQLALSQGYHRDPEKFTSSITPFAGEMRRRVWANIVQIDLRLSSQMGLPRLLKSQECDTKEPRNLLDSDFNESTVDLPPSRPETEVTPVLYTLAKKRIDRVGGLISDLIADTREHPYTEIMELDSKLQEAVASLPPIFIWQPLSQSFMIPPQTIFHRIFLQLALQRYTIWLHRKYLTRSSHTNEKAYEYSRNACLQAAIKILEFQQLIDEETQPHGQLSSMPWVLSPLMQSVFLLGMSVLCYYVHAAKTKPDFPLDRNTGSRIYTLLQNTYPMWLRSSIVSHDARQAVEHLSVLLGLQDQKDALATDHVISSQDAAISIDGFHWDRYETHNGINMASLELSPSTVLGDLYLSSLSSFDLPILDDLSHRIDKPSMTD